MKPPNNWDLSSHFDTTLYCFSPDELAFIFHTHPSAYFMAWNRIFTLQWHAIQVPWSSALSWIWNAQICPSHFTGYAKVCSHPHWQSSLNYGALRQVIPKCKGKFQVMALSTPQQQWKVSHSDNHWPVLISTLLIPSFNGVSELNSIHHWHYGPCPSWVEGQLDRDLPHFSY